MKYGSLILEKKEYVYLKRLLNLSGYEGDQGTQKCLTNLTEELKTAHIVDEEDMPQDIIRFNSLVTVAFDNGVEKTVQLVIPIDRDLKTNKISILTPMGSALIGYSQDDSIDWDFPNGKHKIKILEVRQKINLRGIDLVL